MEPGAEHEQLLARLEEKLAAPSIRQTASRWSRDPRTALFEMQSTPAPDSSSRLARDQHHPLRHGARAAAGVVFSNRPASRPAAIARTVSPSLPGRTSAAELADALQHPQDIASTILQLLGMAGQAQMDGRASWSSSSLRRAAAPQPVSDGSALLPEDGTIENRLRARYPRQTSRCHAGRRGRTRRKAGACWDIWAEFGRLTHMSYCFCGDIGAYQTALS